MTESPFAAYVSFREIAEVGRLSPALRAQIAVALAGELAGSGLRDVSVAFRHAVELGVDPGEIALNRRGSSRQPKIAAALDLARRVARGAEEIDALILAGPRAVGWRDDEIAEIIACVVLRMVDACQPRGPGGGGG